MLAQERLKELNIKGVNETAQRTAMKEMGLERARTFGWPNTYVFTKAMGEMLLGDYRENLPLVIARPTIVTSTYKDPFPGWIEGIRTIDSIIVSCAKGNLKCFMAGPDTIMDVIPVDMVVNLMFKTMMAHSSQPSQIIYQSGSSVRNPLKYSHLSVWCHLYFSKNPCISKHGKPINYRVFSLLPSRSSFKRYVTLHYRIPLQVFRMVNGTLCQLFHTRYSQADRNYNQIMRVARLSEPYVFFKARFDESNSGRFREVMKEEGLDVEMFQIDPKCIDWEHYFTEIHIPGAVKYLIK